MTRPDVSIIIPHYDDLIGLDRCLTAVEALERPEGLTGPVEVIVADNGSPQGREIVERVIAGRASVVICPTRGAGPARNHGVDASSGALLAFTDADCVPEPEWLAAGVAHLEETDIVGGRMTVLVGDRSRMTGAEAFETVFAFNNERYVRECRFSVTANLFCRRETFLHVGGFRTGVSEDLDWCRRAQDKGYDLSYAPRAVVGHPARADWKALRRKWERLTEEEFGLIADTTPAQLRWLLKGWALPPSAIVHAPKVLASPDLDDPRQRLVALVTLFRLRIWRFTENHSLFFRRWMTRGSGSAGRAAS